MAKMSSPQKMTKFSPYKIKDDKNVAPPKRWQKYVAPPKRWQKYVAPPKSRIVKKDDKNVVNSAKTD